MTAVLFFYIVAPKKTYLPPPDSTLTTAGEPRVEEACH